LRNALSQSAFCFIVQRAWQSADTKPAEEKANQEGADGS